MKSEGFSFTFIDAEDNAASEKWQKIFICRVLDWKSSLLDRAWPVLFSFLKECMPNGRLRLCGFFVRLYVISAHRQARKHTGHRELDI
jgi:hypothetical protein